MKRIVMTKYGFVRWSEQDFGDDGNRFTCYRVGNRIRVTKCTSDGQVYLSATIDGRKLPYEVFSKLTHYPALDKLNGVSIASLTDDDLYELFDACVLYEKEYTEAENTIVMPTINDIKAQCAKVQAKRLEELAEINQHLSVTVVSKVSKWEWASIGDYILGLMSNADRYDPDKYPQEIVGTARSINFCKPDCAELQPSFYYKWIMERLTK